MLDLPDGGGADFAAVCKKWMDTELQLIRLKQTEERFTKTRVGYPAESLYVSFTALSDVLVKVTTGKQPDW